MSPQGPRYASQLTFTDIIAHHCSCTTDILWSYPNNRQTLPRYYAHKYFNKLGNFSSTTVHNANLIVLQDYNNLRLNAITVMHLSSSDDNDYTLYHTFLIQQENDIFN